MPDPYSDKNCENLTFRPDPKWTKIGQKYEKAIFVPTNLRTFRKFWALGKENTNLGHIRIGRDLIPSGPKCPNGVRTTTPILGTGLARGPLMGFPLLSYGLKHSSCEYLAPPILWPLSMSIIKNQPGTLSKRFRYSGVIVLRTNVVVYISADLRSPSS
jgi:hypothetical protein